MTKFKDEDLANYPYQLPPDWEEQTVNSFNRFKDATNILPGHNLMKFLDEFLVSCPQEMRDTMPPLEEFLNRYSGSIGPGGLTLPEFKNFWRETYFVKYEFEKKE